jgi:hypothetical protein
MERSVLLGLAVTSRDALSSASAAADEAVVE